MKKIVFIFLACSLSLLHAQETVEIARADLSTMYREAQRAEKNGNLDEAISIYKSILFIKDQQPIPYLKMANIYAADPNNAESVSLAIAFYQKYLELDPNSRNAATIHNQVTKLQTLMAEKKATEGWQEYSIDLTAVIQSDPEKTEDIIRTTVHPALKAETKEEIEKEVDDVMLADIYASRMLKAQSAKDSIAATKENQLLESDTNFTFFHIPRLPHLVADSSIINKRKATTRFILRAKAYEKENQLDSAIMCYYSVLYIDSSSFEYYKNIGYLWYKYAAETADTTKYDYAIESYTMYLLYKKKELKGIFKKTMDIKESTEYQNTCNDMQIIIQNKKALTEQFAAQTHLDIWNHYEGMWVAYWFSGDRMQPQWVFSIEKDTVKNLL
ncbi:MAG: hypothetical protein LBK03_05565, partial [Bacteroidales bacterium]|nr:hypothetical protein [Bacteroidales bacterium]